MRLKLRKAAVDEEGDLKAVFQDECPSLRTKNLWIQDFGDLGYIPTKSAQSLMDHADLLGRIDSSLSLLIGGIA